MGANGYEIRHALMNEARDLLMQGWHQKVDVESRAAQYENRVPREIPIPSVEDISKVASEMYQFVQRKDS